MSGTHKRGEKMEVDPSGPQIMVAPCGTRRKLTDEEIHPPELPPRPPPCPRHRDGPPPSAIEAHLHKKRLKKYVFLCTVCGGLASLLGGLFLAVYLILRSYTSSLDYFETIPTYIPAAMLLITGLGIMCLARRRNRYAILIKLCGVCCLLCAATCVLVTVTTTVIHMSRLQSLRECVYTIKTQTCTCYSMLLDSNSERSDEGAHYVFNSITDCEVIHGPLYSCLRAMFGLSVIGILVCIFCCMLVYQLLSHERKKMYWEQLELRCRYLYGQPRNQPVITPPQRCSHCACSQQFRLWAGGRIGNLYSPNPVGDEPPANTGWGWRLPWSRTPDNVPQVQPIDNRESVGYHQPLNCSSPDSQYGFAPQGVATVSSGTSASYTMIDPPCQVYQWGPPPPYSDPNSPRRACPPGPHNCSNRNQENYVNTADTEAEDHRLQVRGRRPQDCSSSSSKSEERPPPRPEDIVSPRIKYLRQTMNPVHKRAELSESEVYFADVSSCCNGSVRNDSLLYEEPNSSEQPKVEDAQLHGPFRKDVPRKQPRFVPDKNLRTQIQESGKEFQKIPEERASSEAYSEMAHDGSEEDDPELVTFSQRHESRNRMSDNTRSQCRNRMDLSQINQDFPSPMSISSPSSGSKEMSYYPDTMNSDNGSADSVWSGYSPDFLAPDAQYETIPEHRIRNERENTGSNKPSPKRRVVYEAQQEWQRYQEGETDHHLIQNINSPKTVERKAVSERARNDLNSPKMARDGTVERYSSPDNMERTDQLELRGSERFVSNEREFLNGNCPKPMSRKYIKTMESPAHSYDRCGNVSGHYEEEAETFENPPKRTFERYQSGEIVYSPRHHYEEIKENRFEDHREESPQVYPRHCTNPSPEARHRMDASAMSVILDSPKVFDSHLFSSSNHRSSPDCLALVDESQCCHNDASCRCLLGISNSVSEEPIKPVNI